MFQLLFNPFLLLIVGRRFHHLSADMWLFAKTWNEIRRCTTPQKRCGSFWITKGCRWIWCCTVQLSAVVPNAPNGSRQAQMVLGCFETNFYKLRCLKLWCWLIGSHLQALSLLEDLQLKTLEVDVVPYGAAINACAKGHQWLQAILLLFAARHGNFDFQTDQTLQ